MNEEPGPLVAETDSTGANDTEPEGYQLNDDLRSSPRPGPDDDPISTHETLPSTSLTAPPCTSNARTPTPARRRSLKPVMLRAIDLLLSGRKVHEVCEILGCHRQRIWEWSQREDFQAELARRRDQLWVRVQGPLVERVEEALHTLAELLHYDPEYKMFNHSPEIRLAAARVVMGVAARGVRGGS